MELKTKELLYTLQLFSEIFNIPPPKSNDIGCWWEQVVKEIKAESLYLLYENNVLGRCDNDVLIFMNTLLTNRIKNLEVEI